MWRNTGFLKYTPAYDRIFWSCIFPQTENSAFFQIMDFSRFCYVLLRNLQFVYGSGNGNVYDYVIRRSKTREKSIIRNWTVCMFQAYLM